MNYKWKYSDRFEEFFNLHTDDITMSSEEKIAVLNVWRSHDEWYYKIGIFREAISQLRSQFKKEDEPFYFAYFIIEEKDLIDLKEAKLTKAFEARETEDKIAYV
jgi:hypothetical protein